MNCDDCDMTEPNSPRSLDSIVSLLADPTGVHPAGLVIESIVERCWRNYLILSIRRCGAVCSNQ
jgi:hypothetical protein